MSALGKVKIFQAKGERCLFKQWCALPWPINGLANYVARGRATVLMENNSHCQRFSYFTKNAKKKTFQTLSRMCRWLLASKKEMPKTLAQFQSLNFTFDTVLFLKKLDLGLMSVGTTLRSMSAITHFLIDASETT
jgi:hypothetical protein